MVRCGEKRLGWRRMAKAKRDSDVVRASNSARRRTRTEQTRTARTLTTSSALHVALDRPDSLDSSDPTPAGFYPRGPLIATQHGRRVRPAPGTLHYQQPS